MTLGQFVKLKRKKMGLTQQQFAHEAGLSMSTLTRIEQGVISLQTLNYLTIEKLANTMNYKIEIFVKAVGERRVRIETDSE